MEDATELGPNAKKMTRAHFQAICDVQFRNYLSDAQTNPILALSKEIRDIQRQIEEVVAEGATYEKTCEVIVKHQENFLHKFGMLPKQGTRTVGVNVNITSPEDRNSDLKQKPLGVGVPPQTLLKPVNTDPSQSSILLLSPSNNSTNCKSNVPKRSSVDVVDLTVEDEKSRPKQFRSVENVQNYSKLSNTQETQTNVQRDNVNFATVPLMTSLQQMIQIGSPPVQFPGSGTIPASFLGSSKPVAPVIGQPQRIAYVLPSSVVPRVAVPSNKPNESTLKVNGTPQSGTMFLASRPPTGHLLSGRPSLEPLSNLQRATPKHPAPLPESPRYFSKTVSLLEPPPKPSLKISKPANGIVLSWNMTLTGSHDKIKTYQLYGYEENSGPVDTSLWKKVGEVNALALPMACTLTQFADGRRYHFAIRAVDVHTRIGPFSDIASISLLPAALASGK